MSSIYRKINGKNYVKSMLDTAEEKSASKKGGKMSLVDARSIFQDISGDSLTETEIRTASYILENFSFSEAALKWIEKTVSPTHQDIEIVESHSVEEEILSYREEISEYKGIEATEKSSSKKFIIFILLLAAVTFGVIFFLIKKDKQETIPAAADEEQISDTAAKETVEKTPESVEKKDAVETTAEAVKAEPEGRLYVVKHGDTLVKISIDLFNDYSRWQEIYTINKDVIKAPGMVYPGQTLKIPEK